MSDGSPEVDRVMAPLMFVGLFSEQYNRIYEAVEILLYAGANNVATRLVLAIAALAEREKERT